jgi:zinc transport system substrate-binding protein
MNRIRSPLLVLLTLLPWACGSPPEESTADPDPVVVSSIFPVGDLIQRMVGEEARVQVLLPPGASPATFDLTPRQFQDMQRASLYVMVGGGLDEWTSELSAGAGDGAKILRLSEGLELLGAEAGEEEEEHGHSHGAGNPHIWLDPILVRDQLLPKMSDALASAFPQEATSIREREKVLADSLTALDLEIRQALDPVQNRAFISTHSAWTYFAARYGVREVGVIHASPGREPSGRDLARLVQVAQDQDVRCLFTEPQLGEVAARALATELSLPVRVLDPLGGPEIEGRTGYFSLLRYNAKQLREGLMGGGP